MANQGSGSKNDPYIVYRPLPNNLVNFHDPRLQADWQALYLTAVNMPTGTVERSLLVNGQPPAT